MMKTKDQVELVKLIQPYCPKDTVNKVIEIIMRD